MRLIADLHIHSRFSRATSRSLNLDALASGARTKGIRVIGTGDFTHPVWLGEIESELKESPSGLLFHPGHKDISFMLTAEISTIYKHGDKVRKVHHLIGTPDVETAKKISLALSRIGNIKSDGRPIIGMSSRNLLELVLEASPDAFIIPAHIWTPWFSALGSKSGFDSIEECYLDLSPYIFACETGLSSDPPMNRMVKSLDKYFLVSNSDAHSAEKLGREATVFDCEPGYQEMLAAMRTGKGLTGTIEFFPEEGKYHLDGHRDCGVVLEPEETKKLKGRCPACGKPLTIGVQYRVHELADRFKGRSPKHRPFHSVIPLKEILGEVLSVGPASARVEKLYETMLTALGPELSILLDAPVEDIARAAGEKAGLAISRMRSGRVSKKPGYDGVFGVISVLAEEPPLAPALSCEEDVAKEGVCDKKQVLQNVRHSGESRNPAVLWMPGQARHDGQNNQPLTFAIASEEGVGSKDEAIPSSDPLDITPCSSASNGKNVPLDLDEKGPEVRINEEKQNRRIEQLRLFD